MILIKSRLSVFRDRLGLSRILDSPLPDRAMRRLRRGAGRPVLMLTSFSLTMYLYLATSSESMAEPYYSSKKGLYRAVEALARLQEYLSPSPATRLYNLERRRSILLQQGICKKELVMPLLADMLEECRAPEGLALLEIVFGVVEMVSELAVKNPRLATDR
jgi:hypothetical protein